MLKLHYLSFDTVSKLNAKNKVDTIIKLIQENNIVLIEGRLKSTEEALLIRSTMNIVTEKFEHFPGIELGVLHGHRENTFIEKIRTKIAQLLIGERRGITIIGPARIIKELKQHPEMIELHLSDEYIKQRKSGTRNLVA